MQKPTIVGINEVHRAGAHLAQVTVEVDIVDFPRLVGGLDTAPGLEASLERTIDTAEAMAKVREAEPAPGPRDDDPPPAAPPAPPSE